MYEHQDEFYSIYGEQDVKRKIQTVWGSGANQFVNKEGDQLVLDKKGFKRYVKTDGKIESRWMGKILLQAPGNDEMQKKLVIGKHISL